MTSILFRMSRQSKRFEREVDRGKTDAGKFKTSRHRGRVLFRVHDDRNERQLVVSALRTRANADGPSIYRRCCRGDRSRRRSIHPVHISTGLLRTCSRGIPPRCTRTYFVAERFLKIESPPVEVNCSRFNDRECAVHVRPSLVGSRIHITYNCCFGTESTVSIGRFEFPARIYVLLHRCLQSVRSVQLSITLSLRLLLYIKIRDTEF